MRVTITSSDHAALDGAAHDLNDDLRAAVLDQDVSTEIVHGADNIPVDARTKGDAVTIAAIVLTLVGTGGALTAAVSPGGAITRLADVLEAYVNRNLDIELELSDGRKTKLSGPANVMRDTVARLLRADRS